MVFYLVLHYVARTAVNLLGDVIAKLRTGEGFLLTLGIDQVGRFHHDDGVLLGSARNMLLHALELADFPVAQLPVILAVGNGVVLDVHRCKVADEFLVLELVEAESVAVLHVVVVMLHIGNHSPVYLQLYIFGTGILLFVLVHRLEVLPDDGSVGNDVG